MRHSPHRHTGCANVLCRELQAVGHLRFMLAVVAVLSGAVHAAETPTWPRASIWLGPHAFVSGRTFRDDYTATLLDASRWPTVLPRIGVLKLYLMVLPADPVPGKSLPEMPDDQMRALARFVREHDLQVAVETGGIRAGKDVADGQLGVHTAQGELRHLRRWLGLGGRLDYLTTDHGVMLTIGAPYVQPKEHVQRSLTLLQVIDQLAEYYGVMHREFPTAKLGCIESLGFFEVDGPGGRHYARTVPALPKWPFDSFLDTLLAAMRRRGVELDHFHIDFGYEGVRHDGGGQGRLDYGRIRGVEAVAQARGVKAGVIVNAFHGTAQEAPERQAANRQACEHTVSFLDGYFAAGGRSEHLVFQTWQPYPDRTGPESDADTVMGLAKALLERVR